MSSGFISGGTADAPTERDDEWRRAQAEIESARQAKADALAAQNGKSLFEILQANKDKKQADFEEKARYKLHVSLDDDEADYLREVLEKKRQEEEKVRRDEGEGLEAFKRQKEEAEKRAVEDEESGEGVKDGGEVWASAGRKRKMGNQGGLLKGVKLRKANSAVEDKEKGGMGSTEKQQEKKPEATLAKQSTPTASKPSTAPGASKPTLPLSLGLGYASSDDED